MTDHKKFDPCKYRLARDIRNSLSKSFFEAIVERNGAIFRELGAEFLARDLDQIYQQYILSRLEKYEEVLALIRQDQVDEILHQAGILWDYGLYFEMHDFLEKIWINAEADERRALQALIRAAGMKIHAECGKVKSAVSMGRKARADLQIYGKILKGFSKLDPMLTEIENTLIRLESTP